jgi:prepilin-type N-terminal cleavage/methylation domain-containing protein
MFTLLELVVVLAVAGAAFALGAQIERTRLDLHWRRKLAKLEAGG